ncbi:MAG: 4Fe-4S binding protein, partial [Chitinispirillia bacterium]
MNPVLLATLSLLGLGLLAAIILVIAAKLFYVWEDPKIADVEEALLGANCGGCGFAGCSAAAEAVVKGNAKADVCIAGGFDIAVAVSRVMGVTVKEKEKEISVSGCRYGLTEARSNYTYIGARDCSAAMMLFGGSKECSIGCIGLGTCEDICPFDAITMSENRLPIVNAELCTGCGTCTNACPKGIIRLTSNTIRMTTEYTADECTAPCQRSCPSGIDIPKYIGAIAKSDFDGAVQIMMEKNPLLSICGRICPAPCETECRRNLVDQPLAINLLKKFVTDYEKRENRYVPVFMGKKTGKKIAVIGGGAEGLTAAFFLARLGHEPEIFEANTKLGGILRYVISKDRLPPEILDWDIKRILNIGVTSQTGKTLGKDFTLNSLFQQGKDAVLITSGGIDSRTIIQGASAYEKSIPGMHLLIDFLIANMKGKAPEIGEKVCIIGSGKSVEKAVEIMEKSAMKEIHIITNNNDFVMNSHDTVIVHSDSIP